METRLTNASFLFMTTILVGVHGRFFILENFKAVTEFNGLGKLYSKLSTKGEYLLPYQEHNTYQFLF